MLRNRHLALLALIPSLGVLAVGTVRILHSGHRTAEVGTSEVISLPAPGGIDSSAAALRFDADLSEGRIGATRADLGDDARDNVFHVQMDRAPGAADQVWLEYELDGSLDHHSVARSVNHQPVHGGRMFRRAQGWSAQRERIPAERVHRGDNVILFSTWDPAAASYRVRNVRLVVEPGGKHPSRDLVITGQDGERPGVTSYIRGFVVGKGARVLIDGHEVALDGCEFEWWADEGREARSIMAEAVYPDGERVSRTCRSVNSTPATAIIREEPIPVPVHAHATPSARTELTISGARLFSDTGSVPEAVELSVTALRNVDLAPLPSDLVNVTGRARGFRFLPNGFAFRQAVRLELEFDPSLIPAGYTPADIHTYYFDEHAREWKRIPRDTVLVCDVLVRSRTTHFTDHVNGIIQVPESPETMGYTPTSIKDYKAGDVSAGITPLSLPAASNTGAATTRFPLKLPKGRQGMQPELAIQYNSEGGNGWLGLGWDLRTPSITLDTRWGVPRYDGQYETETYLLDGEMLSPVGHREWVLRDPGDKQFYPRVEGAFREIIRHGTGTDDYTWEVTDKTGTRSFYGGVGGVDDGAVLRDAQGNIAKWQLVKVIDSNNNNILYQYDIVDHDGTAGSPNVGQQIYPRRIQYTGLGDDAGKYSVEFERDPGARPDKQVNCRLGLKEVTAHRLSEVRVRFNDELIRRYRLSYSVGAFYKSLLSRVDEYDNGGSLFYSHTFKYWDEIRQNGDYLPYALEDEWNDQPMPDDGLAFNGWNPNVPDEAMESSFLGGSLTENYAFGGSANIGPAGNPFLQTFTIGGSFGYSKSSGDALATFMDMDGDNLSDKVYRSGDEIYYRRNLIGEGSNSFSAAIPTLNSGGHFSKTSTKTFNYGWEAHAGPAFYGRSKSRSTTNTKTYFLDRNGDGLMDICRDGLVHFGFRNDQDQIEFDDTSDPTENPIEAGSDILLQAIDTAEIYATIAESPLIDVVRTWVAPYSGWISIEAPVSLVTVGTPEAVEYEHEDGVRLTVQKGDSELCVDSITSDDASTHDLLPCLGADQHVNRGERIYFRLQSKWDGALDRVQWDPTVTYQTIDALGNGEQPNQLPVAMQVDANGRKRFTFRASDDFLVANEQGIQFVNAGTIRLDSTLIKPVTSDTIWLEVIREYLDGTSSDTLLNDSYAPDEPVDDQPVEVDSIAVDSGQVLRFKVRSTSNVEWQDIKWKPRVSFIHHEDYTDQQLLDTLGRPLLKFLPVVDMTALNEPRGLHPSPFQSDQPLRPYIPDSTGWVVLDLDLGCLDSLRSTEVRSVTLTVKTRHALVAKRTEILPTNYEGIHDFGPLTFQAVQGDTFFVEVNIPDRKVSDKLFIYFEVEPTDTVPNYEEIEARFGVNTAIDTLDRILGPLHYRWGQFGYNYTKLGAPITDPINEGELVFDTSVDVDGLDFGQSESELDQLEGGSYSNPLHTVFYYMFADRVKEAWVSLDEGTFIKGDLHSASRLGEDDVSFPLLNGGGGGFVTAPVKVSKETSKSRSYGVSILMGLGYNDSEGDGTSRTVMDAMDLDGDRYPDVVAEDRIQGTVPNGGYETNSRPHEDSAHVAVSHSHGWAAGGSFVKPNFSNTASPSAGVVESAFFLSNKSVKDLFKCEDAQEASGTSLGVNINFNTTPTKGEDHVLVSWNDVNGDGLPDKVYRQGQVALNIGRSFLPKEDWNYNEVREGTSKDWGYGGGGSINVSNFSFAFGVSASRTENGARIALLDVNGDGLVDIVYADDRDGGTEWLIDKVKINKGNGFAPVIDWPMPQLALLDRNHSIGESGNASFSYGVVIWFIKLVGNVNGAKGHGFSRTETQFSDINGDGFPDFLRSTDDDNLTVYASTIGRTNLLKEARGPFGTQFKVDYEVAGNTYDLPQSKWVMRSVAFYDGHIGDGPDSTYTTFEYADGQYDRREREAYGFATVRTKEWDTQVNSDTPYRTMVQTYDVSGYYTKGLPLVKTLFAGEATKYTESINSYRLLGIDGDPVPPSFNTTNDDSQAFPALIRTEDLFYEGHPEAGMHRSVTYTYDEIGNVTQYIDSGNVGYDDVVTADITYWDHQGSYIVGLPEDVEIKVDGTTVRHRWQEVEESTGNITQIKQWFDDGPVQAVYDLTYDNANGNLTEITRPVNNWDLHMFYKYEYDTAVATYVTKVIDAYEYSSESQYEYLFGQLIETSDINDQVTRYRIDNRGRVDTVIGPYEVAAEQLYTIAIEYHPEADVPYARVKHFDPQHAQDGIDTYTFLDGLFRPILVKKTALVTIDDDGNTTDQMIMSGAARYDAFGRVIREWYPTASIDDPEVFEVNLLTPYTTTKYDVLDRKDSVILADGALTRTVYDFGEADDPAFLTTVFDALGNKKKTYADIRGRQVARVDFDPDSIRTRFHYNGVGDLLDVTDHGDNVTTYTYDLLGRKLTYDHPDGGLTKYKYDPAGNLIEKLTGNLLAWWPEENGPIKYTYERERLKRIDYPRNYQNQVTYEYGADGASFNRAGRVVLQLDASGGQEFFYGPLGEVEKTIRTIIVSQSDIRTYVSEQKYDTWNRIQQMSYPDGEVVKYHYNRAGMLEKMDSEKGGFQYSVIDKIGYDLFEQRVYLKQGNSVVTNYSYEPDRRRLDTLTVTPPGGPPIMDNVYTYDLVNNVLSLENQRQLPQSGEGGSILSTYDYDPLYRLVHAHAAYTGNGREDSYDLTMEYDELHNIVSKSQDHSSTFPWQVLSSYDHSYTYDGALPHAPSRIGDRDYTYDANGNQLGWAQDAVPTPAHREIAWDEENRMQALSDDGYISQFTYDASGERVLKSHGGMQSAFVDGVPVGFVQHRENYSIYASPYLVLNEQGFTKHYYIEGQRVASRVGTGKFYNGAQWPTSLNAGGLNYAARILLLQQAAQQLYIGQGLPPGPPTMPNYYGQPEQGGDPIYVGPIANTQVPAPSTGWPQPPLPVGDPTGPPGPPTVALPSVTRETVEAGCGFQNETNQAEPDRYFFHPDHLGSANYITDAFGHVRQHIEYMAFGETFLEEHTSDLTQPYLYNGKELDRVTGLYYYGVRYYDPVISLWASVDPVAEQSAERSPFSYVSHNPINMIDPDGQWELSVAAFKLGGEKGTFENRALMAKAASGSTTVTVNNGRALLAAMANVTKEHGSITKLIIASHSGPVGLYMDSNSGLYTSPSAAIANNIVQDGVNFSAPTDKAAYISDLVKAVAAGTIKFDKNAEIVLTGCNTAMNMWPMDSFAEDLSEALPGVAVTGASGYATPEIKGRRETGRFNAWKDKHAGPKNEARKWLTYQNGKVIRKSDTLDVKD